VRVGGSIGVIHDFQKVLGVPILLVPLANLDGNMHGTDENMTLTAIQKGLQFSQLFFGV
jgi:acetylornithine deacetylase/succinyl-diaminopimelate desuccinylase-like protein